jgi:hypothetical protein
MAVLTMEVSGRYWRARPGVRGHVFFCKSALRAMSIVPAHARPCPG